MPVSLLYACASVVYGTVLALRYFTVKSANRTLCVFNSHLLCIHCWIQPQSGRQAVTNNNEGKWQPVWCGGVEYTQTSSAAVVAG